MNLVLAKRGTRASARKMALPKDSVPLVVDVDGTLVRSDLLVESVFACLGHNPLRLLGMLGALAQGKAALKAYAAELVPIDPAHLPYEDRVLDLIREARAAGRPVYLVSASNGQYVRAIAEHLGLFDGWYASDDALNLSAEAKARHLVEMFGEGGFDYIGNDADDLPVWRVSRKRIALCAPGNIEKCLREIDPEATILSAGRAGLRPWLKLLRVHQWAKNGLVFVALFTAHLFTIGAFAAATGAFLAFSLAASGIYILNDLVDIDADRSHRSKKNRPLAAGTVPIWQAMAVAPALVAGGLVIAAFISLPLLGLLCAYLVLTTGYSFVLKRKLMVDVVALAMLYTLRVLAGGAAIGVPISEWLLAFSMLIFTGLALMKRYVELAARLDADLPDPTNRNYRKSDLDIIAALAAASGFNAITVFALYVSSPATRELYSRPELLWIICPILLYWFGRALMMAHRRDMDDDPIVFAIKDHNSIAALILIGGILITAI